MGEGKVANQDATSDDDAGGKTSDRIGGALGVSGRTLEKIAAVMEAAETDPAKFGPIAEQMDETRNVSQAYNELKAAQAAAKPEPEAEPKAEPQPGRLRAISIAAVEEEIAELTKIVALLKRTGDLPEGKQADGVQQAMQQLTGHYERTGAMLDIWCEANTVYSLVKTERGEMAEADATKH